MIKKLSHVGVAVRNLEEVEERIFPVVSDKKYRNGNGCRPKSQARFFPYRRRLRGTDGIDGAGFSDQ